jgi:hypothetical protein
MPVKPDGRIRAIAIGTAVLVLAGAISVIFTVGSDGGPPHPASWDPRVAKIAEFVEKERGLTYAHPVYVDFLTPDKYKAASTTPPSKLTAAQREAFTHDAEKLRALGLAKGDLDLAAALNKVRDSGTLAFYSSQDERVRVRGSDLTPSLRVTLAHELTHALQDQHFNLDRLFQTRTQQASTALRALAEGDAIRIEKAYSDNALTAEERAAYEKEYLGSIETSQKDLSSVPVAINADFAAPYFLGEPFVLALLAGGGNAKVDEAFRHPPTTEEQIFSPVTYLQGQGAKKVDPVTLGKGDKLIDKGDFGSISWYLTLGERIDPFVDLGAVDGWGGDATATFTRGGKLCVRTVWVGDTAKEDEEMTAAIDLWVAAMPGNATRVSDKGRLGFESCDPGPKADFVVAGKSLDLMQIPALRSFFLSFGLATGDANKAQCVASAILSKLTYAELTDPKGAVFQDPKFATLVAQARAACA